MQNKKSDTEARVMPEIAIPRHIQTVLDTLKKDGHEAYIVGGCVRDSIMGKMPNDWDVCTSANPQETKKCFPNHQTMDMGMKHGTIGVIFQMKDSGCVDCCDTYYDVVEITTYRIDGEYRDSRHPDEVRFTKEIEEDLARRDFTMNAIAYIPSDGYVDPYNGKADIESGIIRTVGNPVKRFNEDALRIMRGLRFAAQLGFEIEKETAEAMSQLADTVCRVSQERVQAELGKLIAGSFVDSVMEKYGHVLEKAVPGIRCVPVAHLPDIKTVRLAKLFPMETEYYMRNLRLDKKNTVEAAALARLFAGEPPENKIAVKRCIRAEGLDTATLYMDALGRKSEIDEIVEKGECCTVEQLDISGRDLIEMGIKDGRRIGETLERMLDMVIEGKLENERGKLINGTD
ncbi:MAG: hypothetical protein PUJ11_01950 [Eubacteriaceae bacterium]|nr:hypothetical protein [Eubacteriaceae bacterium]